MSVRHRSAAFRAVVTVVAAGVLGTFALAAPAGAAPPPGAVMLTDEQELMSTAGMFGVAHVEHLTDINERLKTNAVLLFMTRLTQTEPGISSADLRAYGIGLLDEINKLEQSGGEKFVDQVNRTMFLYKAMEALGEGEGKDVGPIPLSAVGAIAGEYFERFQRPDFTTMEGLANQVSAGETRAKVLESTDASAEAAQLAYLVANSPGGEALSDALTRMPLDIIPITSTAAQIKSGSPAVQIEYDLGVLGMAAKGMWVDVKELREQEAALPGKIEVLIGRAEQRLQSAVQQQGADIVGYLKQMREADQKAREKAQKEAAERAAAAATDTLALQAAAGTVTLLSTIAGQVDDKAGRLIDGFGTAAIKLYTAFDTLRSTLDTIDRGGGLTAGVRALGTLAFTGNVVQIASGLIGLVSGLSSGDPVVAGITQIRKDIANLAAEMRDRFNQLDQRLAGMYQTMIDGFDRLLGVSIITQQMVADVQQRLARVELQVNNLERDLTFDAAEQQRTGLITRLHTALSVQSHPTFTLKDFADLAGDLAAYATITSTRAPAVLPGDKPYTDTEIATVLGRVS